MSEDLASGLGASANEPSADTPTQDAVLDAAFASPEPAASSEPSGDTPPAQEPAAAIAQPPATDPLTNTEKGEPPRERWDSILANARTKAREEALAENREHLAVIAELKRDYPGTLARLLEEGANDPRFSEVITAKAAALLNARRTQAKADQEPQPDAVMRYEDGTTEPSFSPAQLRKWQEWRERQIESKLDAKYKPLHEMQQAFVQHREREKLIQEAGEIAAERGAVWKNAPFFNDHKDAILKRQAELYEEAVAAHKRGEGRFDPVNTPWLLMQQAYNEVVSSQAIPKLQSQQTDSLVAVAARKRAGSASDPAASLPAQPRRPRTVDEAVDQGFAAAGL